MPPGNVTAAEPLAFVVAALLAGASWVGTVGSQPTCSALALPSTGPSVRIHRPTQQSSIAELDAWCSAVGPPVVDLNLHEEATAADIAVLSWNVHGDAGRIADLVSGVRSGSLLGRPAKHLVLLLQEAVRRGDEIPPEPPPGARFARRLGSKRVDDRNLRALARDLGLNLVYVPSMRNGRDGEDRGNAILSTLPIDAADGFELPLGRQRRVVVAASLRRGPTTGRLRVASAHLDTAWRPEHGGPARWRQRQADALVQWLQGDATSTIIGADLNTWWGTDEPAVRRLRRAYPDAVDRNPLIKTWRCPLGTSNRLDYLFAGGVGRLEVNRIDDRFGSDHAPIYASLRPTPRYI